MQIIDHLDTQIVQVITSLTHRTSHHKIHIVHKMSETMKAVGRKWHS